VPSDIERIFSIEPEPADGRNDEVSLDEVERILI